MSRKKKIIFLIVLGIFIIPFIGNAGDWQKSWSEVKSKSAVECRKIFNNYQLQAICMQNEINGYNKLQGNYGMPYDVAYKAKERCQQIFSTFQLQDICMQNESNGYHKMKGY